MKNTAEQSPKFVFLPDDDPQEEVEKEPQPKKKRTPIRNTLAVITFIASIAGIIVGLFNGPVGIGISAAGFLISMFLRGGTLRLARYGVIFGLLGIITGIIASIVHVILAVTPVVLPAIKALGLIGTSLQFLLSLFGVSTQ
ncbi:hypothetical protein SAMN05444392_104218 [Seinonella peptonophila]|uniref:Uncharacterized protein n=1 Tax=Seinonella peptonophila TaxID=112248 RepID=A0A1M4X9V3_9BACL|nr:hypothetical protein [Seinonella peptonophila]SHE90269.1 hypothetical protein SAMN05444392_104218 [Seinonella peptonophila]